MTFYRYLPDHDVHQLDCGGWVDLATGLERLRVLHHELTQRRPHDGIRRFLVDFRQTVWASPEVHMQLSRASRRDLGLTADNTSVRAAFLHDAQSGIVSHNEAWFDNEADGLRWLCGGE